MSSEENKALVRRFFEDVCNGRKLNVADKLFTADHVYHDPATPGAKPGPEGMKEVIATYQTAFGDAHWTVEEMIAGDGDRVITRWTGRGTHTSELYGIAATRKQVTVPGIWIHRVAGGRIAESWNVWDTLGMLQQLGIAPVIGR